jgi:HEPN domain-containing protein
MDMRLTRSAIILVAGAIVAIPEWAYIAYLRGLLNLRDAVTVIVAELAVAAILFAFSRIFGRESNPDELARKFAVEKQKLEEIDRNRKVVYEAIKEWIQPSQTQWQIRGQQEPLYLAEKPSKCAQKIDDCLSRNYSSIWVELQEFRIKYAELMALKLNIPAEFLRQKDDKVIEFHIIDLEARRASIRGPLLAIQRQLVRQINSEIVEKGDTDLKC